jgi:hypothetical protein
VLVEAGPLSKLLVHTRSSGKKKKSKKPSEPTVPEGDEETAHGDDDSEAPGSSDISDLENSRIGSLEGDLDVDDECFASIRERLSLLEALSFSPKGSQSDNRLDDAAARMLTAVGEAGEGFGEQNPSEASECAGLLDSKNSDIAVEEKIGIPPTKNDFLLQNSIFTSLGTKT